MSVSPHLRRLRPAGVIAMTGVILLGGLSLTACWEDSGLRQEKLHRIARWEDQRLAPEDSLAAMLADPDARVRLAAARTAGLIGRQEAVDPLLKTMDDASVAIRCQACFSLGLLGSEPAVEALADAARDPRKPIRLAAMAGLAQAEGGGSALLAATNDEDPAVVMAAWDGLRGRAKEIDHGKLVAAIQGALTHRDANIQWRVLHCAEMVPDSSLIPVITPLARSGAVQVRIHACRALARQNSPAALDAVLEGASSRKHFKGLDRSRVDIALCRALSNLGSLSLGTPSDKDPVPEALAVTEILITAAGSQDPHVAASALDAMAACVKDLPLPAAAAERESLLPVWRIRMQRAAKRLVASPHLGVRCAAVGAWPLLRGAGSASELAHQLLETHEPAVQVAALHAASLVHPDPVPLLVPWAQADRTRFLPGATGTDTIPPLVRAEALEDLDNVLAHRPDALPAGLDLGQSRHEVAGILRSATLDPDFVVAATAAGLLAHYPDTLTVQTLAQRWKSACGPGNNEIRRAVITGIAGMAASPGDSLPPAARTLCADLLQQGFDAADLRIRFEAQEAALATGFVPVDLIPSKASLRATMPTTIRDPVQPPVALPFQAPKVRCVTPRGSFTLALNGQLAPNTCTVFLDLIAGGFYDDLTFHRVVPDFVIQGGDPRGDGWGGPGYTIRSEWSPAPYVRGTLGIAHDGKDTGGSQFFVTLSDQPHLNGRYTVFGKVISGMDIVDQVEIGDHFHLEVIP